MATRDPLRALLQLPDDPNYPSGDPLEGLRENQYQSSVLQRGTRQDLNGEVSPDYSPSEYNRELDAQNAQTLAEQNARDNVRLATESKAQTEELPNVAAQADKAQQEKLAIARAPNEATAAGNLAVEKAKAAQAADAQKHKEDVMQTFLGMQNAGSTGPKYKMSVNANMDPSFSEIPPPPMSNQTRQMAESSKNILDTLDNSDYEGQAMRLQQKGLFQPGVGLIRRGAAHYGVGTLLGVPDQTATDLGQFESTHDLLVANVARALAGARGAGNSAMAARFEKIMNDSGDIPTFLGELKGVRSFLEQQASVLNPGQGAAGAPDWSSPPTADEVAGAR